MSFWLNKYPTSFIILGGDFNVVLSNELDRIPPKKPDSSSNFVKFFAQKFDLIDSWREGHLSLKAFTWSNKTLTRQSRIDFWLTSKTLKNVTSDIFPAPLTDHKTISLHISTGANSPKPSYWKLNSSILEENEVANTILELISEYWTKATEQKRFNVNWELFKFASAKYLRKFSSDVAKKKRKVENDIILRTTTLLSKSISDITESEKTELNDLQQKLDEIYKNRAEGAYVRSRRQWLEEGEQNSAYFFRLERQQGNKNTINKLNINGSVMDNPAKLAEYCSQFYSSLYSSTFCQQTAYTFFQSFPAPEQLSQVDKELCDKNITLKEVEDAINLLKLNKSPGNDGLTSEFYKRFSASLCPFLLKVFEESIDRESLPATLTQGLITLIPKAKKDPLFLDNWRPISLLNNDYKIMASIFASRVKIVLPKIIDECQSGFMRDRHISNNIRLVLDILDYSDLVQDQSLILFLDFYKAFDSLEHGFMLSAIEKYGFGGFFQSALRTLYSNANSSIKLSHGTTPRFPLNRGVRQGCPLSPYIFLIAVQFLNLQVKNSSLKGVSIAKNEIKISQLADDTVLFLKDDSQVPVAINVIQSFSKASGLKLNVNKCVLLPVKNCFKNLICDIPVKDSVVYLGVTITKDLSKRNNENFTPMMEKTQVVFNRWLQRDLSLAGRVLLSKAEGLSRLTYAAQVLDVEPSVCKKVDQVLTNFVWKNKTHYVKKSVVLNPLDKGGLGLIDFASLNNTFKINWIRQHLANPTSIWNFIPHFVFSQIGGLKLILLCSYSIQKIPIKLSSFHKQVLLSWTLIFKHNFSPHKSYIWNNQHIVFKNKSLYLENWCGNGILLISQLFNESGLLYSYSEFLERYKVPVPPREYAIVFDAIPSGLRMLCKCSNFKPPVVVSPCDPTKTYVGKICFSMLSSGRNGRIRALFQENITSAPAAIAHWAKSVPDVQWKYTWTLPQRFFLTNKVKEISYRILHRFYSVKHFLVRFKKDIDTMCAFCGGSPETLAHLFWSCPATKRFWNDVNILITSKVSASFSLYFKYILFGFQTDKVSQRGPFIINLLILLAKFHIHKMKYANSTPSFVVFKKELEHYLAIIKLCNHKKAVKTLTICNSLKLL
ncbi:LINE-1 reverse transcriptase homolog isoform X1 [Acanthochromis polyacanthus]|uniref:LINE-1 reverse transcriptase homolog isoform X1 n=1 Tax=Acanthochromis polyacanthus TaxID=80966 RepID=UPI002234A9FE|nr:LINE-1 reverse transcriptase homolog isoform X1 [Acanthochromis polyacanthus]XP_051811828.1 LINE-1 reverse transcriptase homolog isoform X1 [Acanthochromis polyacanthus]